MEKLFQFFVENWRFTFILKILVILAGALGLSQMQREAFPPVNFAAVSISTMYPGASPEEVEEKITHIIEEELRGITGIKEVFSTSMPDRSDIDVRIDIDRKDVDKIVNEIQRAVQRARGRLPSDVNEDPRVLEIKADEIPIIEVALTMNQENFNEAAREELNSWSYQLKKEIEDLTGVASVRLSGYQDKEFQVYVDPLKLKKLDVGLLEVTQTISSRVKNTPAGYLRDSQNTNMVRVLSPIKDIQSIDDLVIRSPDGRNSVQVKDVGRAIEGRQWPSVLARINGSPSVLIVVAKKGESDAIRLVQDVKKQLSVFESRLPQNLKLNIYNNEGQRVENRLEIVTSNAALGFIVVVLILFLFLPWKIAIISSFSLPLCLLGTIFLMVIQGANFNIITMMALIICLGNLVDNSVVISEYYTRLRENGIEAQKAATQAAHKFWIPFTASTITIIAAFIPMLVTKGVMGQFIKWIPITVTCALLFSLFESLFLLPARLQFLDARLQKSASGENKVTTFDKIENSFAKGISLCVNHRWKTFFALIVLVISGFVSSALFNRFELFPADGIEYYVARFETPVQTSITRTDELSKQVSDAIQAVIDPNDFDFLVVRSGIQQIDVSDPAAKIGENVGFVLISVKPGRAQFLNYTKVLENLRQTKKPEGIEKLTFETINNGPPIGKPVTIRVRSNNDKAINEITSDIMSELKKQKGVFNVELDLQKTGQEYALNIDEIKASATLLNSDLVGLNLRSALQGFRAGQLNLSGEEVEILIRLDENKVNSIGDIENFEIVNSQGQLVPLSRVAKIKKQEAPEFRKNYNFKRTVTITGEVEPAIVTSQQINAKMQAYVAPLAEKNPDVTIKFGGEEESTNESLTSLAFALVMSLIGIFATLVFTFKSFTKPFLILTSIPLGLIGVCYAFIFDQRPLSFIAFIGIVGLSGVVINSAIILVDYIEELRSQIGQTLSLPDILVKASRERFRAVLATGLTTVVGLLPAAWGIGGYDSLLVPMTLALSWGMILGTVLTLMWIPATYLILENFRSRIRDLLKSHN